jgi:flagellar biosynthesis/type III secretory pathway protein FliH
VWQPASAPAQQRWAPEDLVRQPTPEELAAIVTPADDEPPAPDPHAAQVAEAYAQGFEDGRLEGEQGEQARLRSAVSAAQEALDQLRDGEQAWTGTIEENVCALAVAIARQIVAREVETDAGIIAGLVRRAISEFGAERQMRIRVHPQDLALLQAADADAEDGAERLAMGREVRWVADVGVSRGSCIVEGRERIVDGRVDAALERMYRRLTYTNV